jgi:hypothetical protein
MKGTRLSPMANQLNLHFEGVRTLDSSLKHVVQVGLWFLIQEYTSSDYQILEEVQTLLRRPNST